MDRDAVGTNIFQRIVEAAVWEPVAFLGRSTAAPAGAVQASQFPLRLKTLLGDLAINPRILRGPMEQPQEEEKNRDDKYDQGPQNTIPFSLA